MLKSLNGLTLKEKKQYLGKHFVYFKGYAKQAICHGYVTLH